MTLERIGPRNYRLLGPSESVDLHEIFDSLFLPSVVNPTKEKDQFTDIRMS